MAKATLTTKTDPAYDDPPEQRYHFPQTCRLIACQPKAMPGRSVVQRQTAVFPVFRLSLEELLKE